MAIYRQVRQSFWTDAKVVDDFTPEDRYFYLYLMTNPHTNLCGCYELSFKCASDETGYTRETIERLIDRLEKVHNVIRYSKQTKELLIIKWSDYNWTKSPDFRKPLSKEIELVKNHDFKGFLIDLYEGNDTVSTPCRQSPETTVSVSNTVSVSDKDISPLKKDISQKHAYGEYKHVRLTDTEYNNLCNEYGEEDTSEAITYLDEYIEMKGTKYKSHYLALRKWVFDAVREKQQKKPVKEQSIAERWANVT